MWAIASILLRENNSLAGIPHFFHPSIPRLGTSIPSDLTYILHRFFVTYSRAFLVVHMVLEKTC